MSFPKFIQAALLLLVGLAAVPSVWAQTYTVLYSFKGGRDGAFPFAGLVRDSAGNLYGTTVGAQEGGLPGSVFKVNPSVGFTLLHSFKYGGASRPGTLVRDSAGNLYGTTIVWGTSPSTIFKLTKTGSFSVLHTFTAGSGSGGSGEGGTLTLDSVGNLYGTGADNSACGGHGCGFIFKLDPSGNETVLHYFPGGKRGTGPNGGLIRDAAGNLYGTTAAGGGPGNHGVVFKLDPAGNETVLYAFKGEPDGSHPNGGLIRDAAGNFYGTTLWGGKGNCQGMSCGVVFKLDTNGTETVLYSFSGVPDGGNPVAGLVMDSAGNLYGTTATGGAPGCLYYACGVVFKLNQLGKETVLHTFDHLNGAPGFGPEAGVIRDSAGNLYGTASLGGNLNDCQGEGCGVVFKITP
jgi:uncharacterized repeat protein (TIGR03803 family)